MWNKKSTSNKRRTGAADTLITVDTKITGDVSFTGVLFVDGIVKGNVTAEPGSNSILTVGAQGHIEGEINVPQVNIYGYINGDVHATETLNLFKDATIEGDVYYNLLQMAMGSTVNGKLVRKDASRKLLDHQPGDKSKKKSQVTNKDEES
ncbi:MAG: polymer-forming cytoskeletal protein [Gammaproteobacteria bacterium]|nr:polymer-forming cytoskeletal protein [Gammaproteobacteria bacterium]